MKQLFVCLIFVQLWLVPAEALIQNGDLVFQKSTSERSGAIEEATGSQWTHVGIILEMDGKWMGFEGVQPVGVTSLRSFIARSRGGSYIMSRVKSNLVDMRDPLNQTQLKRALEHYLGYDYGYFFEWSDDTIYCSELAWK